MTAEKIEEKVKDYVNEKGQIVFDNMDKLLQFYNIAEMIFNEVIENHSNKIDEFKEKKIAEITENTRRIEQIYLWFGVIKIGTVEIPLNPILFTGLIIGIALLIISNN
jgi:hypothetical protein